MFDNSVHQLPCGWCDDFHFLPLEITWLYRGGTARLGGVCARPWHLSCQVALHEAASVLAHGRDSAACLFLCEQGEDMFCEKFPILWTKLLCCIFILYFFHESDSFSVNSSVLSGKKGQPWLSLRHKWWYSGYWWTLDIIYFFRILGIFRSN